MQQTAAAAAEVYPCYDRLTNVTIHRLVFAARGGGFEKNYTKITDLSCAMTVSRHKPVRVSAMYVHGGNGVFLAKQTSFQSCLWTNVGKNARPEGNV